MGSLPNKLGHYRSNDFLVNCDLGTCQIENQKCTLCVKNNRIHVFSVWFFSIPILGAYENNALA